MNEQERSYFHYWIIGIAQTKAATALITARESRKSKPTRTALYVILLDRETDKLLNILDKPRE